MRVAHAAIGTPVACQSLVLISLCCFADAGGVSMGDKDFIKPLLERRGTVFFGKVGRGSALHFLQPHVHSVVHCMPHAQRCSSPPRPPSETRLNVAPLFLPSLCRSK